MGCGASVTADHVETTEPDKTAVGKIKKVNRRDRSKSEIRRNIESKLESDLLNEGDESSEEENDEDDHSDSDEEEQNGAKNLATNREQIEKSDTEQMLAFAQKYGPTDPLVRELHIQFFVALSVTLNKMGKKLGYYALRVLDSEKVVISETGVIDGSKNLKFLDHVYVRFLEPKAKKFIFEVYRIQKPKRFKGIDDKVHELVGVAQYNITEIRKETKKALQNEKRKKVGEMMLRTGDLRVIKTFVRKLKFHDVKVLVMHFIGKELARMDTLGKSDPYFQLFKYGIFDGKEQLYQSEYIKNTLNPIWQKFSIEVEMLGTGKRMKKLEFVCWDWNKIGDPDFIGSFAFYQNDLVEDAQFVLKQESTGDKNMGNIIVDKLVETTEQKRLGKLSGKELNVESLLTQSGYVRMKEHNTLTNQMVEVWQKFQTQSKKKDKRELKMTKSMMNLKQGLANQ